MSTPADGGRRRTATAKVPFWKRDLSSLGKRTVDPDAEIDHPPFVPTLPSADLLPTVVHERMTVRRIRQWFVAGVVLLLLIAGTTWYLQAGQIDLARARLDAEQQQNADINAQVRSLDPVEALTRQIEAQRTVVTNALAAQPVAREVIEAMDAVVAQSGVAELTTLTVTYTGIPQPGGQLNPCPNPDPFSEQIAIGCVAFTGTADSREQVSRLLRLMEDETLFVGPYVTDTASAVTDQPGAGRITFTGTAGLSPDGLAVPLTPEQIEAIVNPPQPDASPSPEVTP